MVDRLVNSEANARRIALVEGCFGASGQPLKVPGRVLVGEGVLTKACRKKPKPRQFFLFNDLLVYGNIILNKKKYNKQHLVPLEEVKLQSLEDEGQYRNGWLICTRGKSFAVYAATAGEKQEWMAHIDACIRDLLQKGGKKAASDHAAVWVPDSEANSCMVCKRSSFNVINRRHHCRKCGSVVCGPCSSQKFLMPAQSSKPLRVCDPCYATLSKTETTAVGGPLAVSSTVEDSKASDSSGEDDSDDEEQNGNIEIPATTSHDDLSKFWKDEELLSPHSQLGPLPRGKSEV